jgi:1-acyl-sn-glycerol-3-phosphate acyltransferase
MAVRSIIFYLLLGFWTIFMGVICLPYLFVPTNYLKKPIKIWIGGIFFLLKHICKVTHEIRGSQFITSKAMLIASKHQSAFETLALYYYLPKAIFIHKKQLFFIPIFGQYLQKTKMISIDRKGGASTMRIMLNKTKEKIAEGYSIIIFPEGTRKQPGEKPDYKSGFAGIYKETQTNILPVAVNSGNYWPKHTFIKKPGHIIIEFLKIIPSGLERSTILNQVQNIIEEGTKKIN